MLIYLSTLASPENYRLIFQYVTCSRERDSFISFLDQFPDVGGKIVIAFLTILIPLTIAVLQDYFTKKSEKKTPSFAKLDLHVILDHIVQINSLLVFAALPYISQMFWPILSQVFKIIFGAVIVFALVKISLVILNLYDWSKNKRDKYRLSYLESEISDDDLLVVWESLWSGRIADLRLEEKYFKTFVKLIEHRLESVSDRSEIDTQLLKIFLVNLDKRSLLFLDIGDVTRQMLDWYNIAFQRTRERTGADINDWSRYHLPQDTLSEIVNEIIKKTLRSPSTDTGYTFRCISRHLEQNKEDREYIQEIVRSVIRTILEELDRQRNLPTSQIGDALRSVPNEWRVTSEKIKQNDPYAIIIWYVLIMWFDDRIGRPGPRFDHVAEAIVRYLFPKVEPIIFSKLLYFAILSPESRSVAEIIRTPRSFGLTGRTISGDAGDIKRLYRDSIEIQIKESFELVKLLFSPPIYDPAIFTEEKVRSYIKDLDEVTLIDASEKDTIAGWRAIFQHMLELGNDNH
jgi:hypothetical protein